jgi:hypothetical protein
MLIKEQDGEQIAEIYWDDLRHRTQEKLLKIMGGNGNFDVFPIATINITCEEGDNES